MNSVSSKYHLKYNLLLHRIAISIFLLLVSFSCKNDKNPVPTKTCTLKTDCGGDQICYEGTCRKTCMNNHDCAALNMVCITGQNKNFCVFQTEEICDGKDNDNDSFIDENYDSDGDGFFACPSQFHETYQLIDCNDEDKLTFPESIENCKDGKDNDCDGFLDSADPDCVGGCSDGQLACGSKGVCYLFNRHCVEQKWTCDLLQTDLFEMAETLCSDQYDNDCDGLADLEDDDCKPCNEGSERDCNFHEFGVCKDLKQACRDGHWTPCRYPKTFEYFDGERSCHDGLDNDCDGLIDDDGNGNYQLIDGNCATSTITDNKQVDNSTITSGCLGKKPSCGKGVCDTGATCLEGHWVCDMNTIRNYQLKETRCDGLDNDCDGLIDDEEIPQIGDTFVCGGCKDDPNCEFPEQIECADDGNSKDYLVCIKNDNDCLVRTSSSCDSGKICSNLQCN